MSEQPKRRTQEEIIADILSGKLDVGDVKIKEVAVLEKFDCSGDERRLIEKRTFEDGACVEVVKH